MRKQILTIATSALIAVVLTNIVSAGLSDGLVAYYPFDGNANDMSGNGLDGTVYGATPTTDRFGNTDSAYYFDGIDDYIDYGFSSSFCLLDDVSVSFWIKRQHQTAGIILTIEGGPIDFGTVEDNSILFLRVYTSDELLEYIHEYDVGINQTYRYQSIPYNEWTHVAITRDIDAKTVNAYFNGSLVGTFNYTYQTENPSAELNFVIGARSTGIYNYIGSMDEVRLYNRVLSSDEIGQLNETGQPAIIPAPGAIMLGSVGIGIVGWLRKRRML